MASNKEKDLLSHSELAQFYSKKNILVTGASGFLGKLLIQKILRSCPNVKGIYLILRETRKLEPEDRLTAILDGPIFDVLKKDVPGYRKKLHPMQGDVQYEGLGLSTTDRQTLINEIDIVIHTAATVNFDEHIRKAVNTNIRGTKELLDLCEEMKHLDVVMITSTAYSFAPRYKIMDFFMLPPIEPDVIMQMVENIDENVLKKITPDLLGEWPNTYCYTKAIMETIVKSRRERVPVGLFRPSIVSSTYKDPVEGWTDNLNGPVGLTVGVTTGLAHVLLADKKCRPDMVPGDYCINALLAATYDIYQKYNIDIVPDYREMIYNYVATKNTVTLAEYQGYNKKYSLPYTKCYWAKTYFFTTCPVIFWLVAIFTQILPALVVDGIALIKKEKPRLLRIQKNIILGNVFTQNWITRTWLFEDKNISKVWTELSPVDKKIFPFDMKTFDQNDYYKEYFKGVKRYIMKDKMDAESIARDIKKYNKLEMYNYILMCVLAAVLLCIISFKLF